MFKKTITMFYSMTGFGRQELMLDTIHCIIEVKTLNGKQFELNMKLPSLLKQYDIDIRNIIQKKIVRGSTELFIIVKNSATTKPMVLNKDIAKQYYESFYHLAQELNISSEHILNTLLTLPDVMTPQTDSIDEQSWEAIKNTIEKTLDFVIEHRKIEGVMLTQQISNNIANIQKLCVDVIPYEKLRAEKLRDKFSTLIKDITTDSSIDKNRLEQEIIYYIEKFDIVEEKNRLLHHCEYFNEIKNSTDTQKGKKLGFILQEIGREINTMGSKANDSNIQKLVVQMKDELEQAKEQLFNVL